MLDISPILLLSSMIIFLIVLSQLNRSLYQPLFKHMDDRQESIQKGLESTRNNAEDIDSLMKEAQSIIAKAKKEASSIRENAYSEAKALGESKMAEFRSELDSKYNSFVSDLSSQKEYVKNSLVGNIPQFKEILSAKISSI
ncbi:MAG: F0F1 ATP synthase subunit B' [Epsilonproteobacteria bacterium]|nr:F0F1 ATP synthase subunit B' [Campylobacterota bacterium]